MKMEAMVTIVRRDKVPEHTPVMGGVVVVVVVAEAET